MQDNKLSYFFGEKCYEWFTIILSKSIMFTTALNPQHLMLFQSQFKEDKDAFQVILLLHLLEGSTSDLEGGHSNCHRPFSERVQNLLYGIAVCT